MFVVDDILIGMVVAGVIGGTINLMTNSQYINSGWDALGYFGVGFAVGAMSFAVGVATGGASMALGILPGAAQGIISGAVSGALTNGAIQIGNNLVAGRSWNYNLGRSMLQGAVYGAIFGGIGGAWKGYQNAKKIGANIWTGYKEGKVIWEYYAPLKDVPLRPDDPYCYAEASEYADKGHLNRTRETFMKAAGNAEGADVSEVWESFEENYKVNYYLASDDDISIQDWENMGRVIQNNNEVILSITQEKGYHAVNLTGVRYIEKYRIFGGGVRNVIRINYWDTNIGFVNNIRPDKVIKALQIIFY